MRYILYINVQYYAHRVNSFDSLGLKDLISYMKPFPNSMGSFGLTGAGFSNQEILRREILRF
jgi:hypothetical protein